MRQRFEEIKRLNEEKKAQRSRLEGRIETAEEQMKNYGCSSLVELESLIEQKETELNEQKEKLENKLKAMEDYVR